MKRGRWKDEEREIKKRETDREGEREREEGGQEN